MLRKAIMFGGLIVAASTFALVGCNKTQPTNPTGAAPHKDGEQKKDGEHKDGGHKDGGHKDGEGHAHKPGAHGGVMVSLGRDSYHAEVVFEKDGMVRLYMLGKDETKTQEIEVQELVAHVTPAGATDAVQVKFTAERQKADASGKTSLFVAKLPPELHGKKVKVTINNIQIGSERFRIEFSGEPNKKDGHGH